eukprot:m.77336 g.77336  ORF g.77336 m.77336 type:complete len:936 (+) comp14542_c0_seq3:275-3082(+)
MASTQTFRALYAFHADEDDELELQVGDLVDVGVIHQGEWGIGVLRRTQQEGSFPWSYVEPLKEATRPHRLQLVHLGRPSYCQHCGDFIWGGFGKNAYKCAHCFFICHKTCKFFAENNSALECSSVPNPSLGEQPQTINAWKVEDVLIWLHAARLFEFEAVFAQNSIDGSALQALNPARLQSLGVREPFHITMILACVSELVHGNSPMMEGDFARRCQVSQQQPPTDILARIDLLPYPVPALDKQVVEVVKGHRFKLKTFVNPVFCDACRKYLWGLLRQGLQCVECGYNVHKSCMDVVPQCQPQSLCIRKLDKLPPGAAAGMLGEPIESQLGRKEKAPKLVLQCIKAVEKHVTSPGLYREVPSADEIRQLRALLLSKTDVPVDKQAPLVVAGFLLQYFMELPVPIVPFELYDQVIQATQSATEPKQQAQALNKLISQLPSVHLSVLEVLLAHLGKVASKSDKNQMSPVALADVWGPILLRPQDQEIVKAVRDAPIQAKAMELFITHCSCGGIPKLPKAKKNAPPPVQPRRQTTIAADSEAESHYSNLAELQARSRAAQGNAPAVTSRRPPRPSVVSAAPSNPHAELASQPWFAGAMDRVQAEDVLSDSVDGTFLIRVSQTRPGFSLTVKFREIRHVVIVESGGKYGFSEPCTFDTLADLIKHFQTASLSCYNAELETTLAYPFKQAPKQTSQPDMGAVDEPALDEEVYISNVTSLKEKIDRAARQVGQAQRLAPYYSTRVKQLQRDLRAQEEILAMLREQKKLHESYHQDLVEHERQDVMANYNLLKERIVHAERDYQQLNRAVRAEQEKEEQVLGSHGGRRKGYPGSQNQVPDVATSPFYIGLVPRQDAERMLERKPDGTFLVRKSNRATDPYTLSLRYGNQTKHIQIKFDGQRFGLAEPLAFYSLDALCDYYKTEKLSNTIDTSLTTPIREQTA